MLVKIKLRTCDEKAVFLPYKLYRKGLTNAVYSFLNHSNADYGKLIHENGWSSDRPANIKLFCYSDLLGKNILMDDEGISFLSDTQYLKISSPDQGFISHIASGAILTDVLDIAGRKYKIESIKKYVSPEFSTYAVFKSITPIVISSSREDQQRNIPRFLRSSFVSLIEQRLVHNMLVKYSTFKNQKIAEIPLKIKVLSITDKIKYHEGAEFSFPCFYGSFALQGDPELIKFAYQVGLGEKTGMGFGFVEEGD